MMRRKVLVVGNSHTKMIQNAADIRSSRGNTAFDIEVCWLKTARHGDVTEEDISKKIAALRATDLLVMTVLGTLHNVIGLFNHDIPFSVIETMDGPVPVSGDMQMIPFGTMRKYFEVRIGDGGVARRFADLAICPKVHFTPPPPKDFTQPPPPKMVNGRLLSEIGYAPKENRLALWKLDCDVARTCIGQFGVRSIDTPIKAVTPAGFLAEEFSAADVTHANAAYGELILQEIDLLLDDTSAMPGSPSPDRGHRWVG